MVYGILQRMWKTLLDAEERLLWTTNQRAGNLPPDWPAQPIKCFITAKGLVRTTNPRVVNSQRDWSKRPIKKHPGYQPVPFLGTLLHVSGLFLGLFSGLFSGLADTFRDFFGTCWTRFGTCWTRFGTFSGLFRDLSDTIRDFSVYPEKSPENWD